jgi:hypothetical protein
VHHSKFWPPMTGLGRTGKARTEQIMSGVPPITDMAASCALYKYRLAVGRPERPLLLLKQSAAAKRHSQWDVGRSESWLRPFLPPGAAFCHGPFAAAASGDLLPPLPPFSGFNFFSSVETRLRNSFMTL